MPRRPSVIAALALSLALSLALGGCFTDPQKQIDQMQQMNDLADALIELNQRTSDLQISLDSMRMVVARQDSVLRRVAIANGISYR